MLNSRDNNMIFFFEQAFYQKIQTICNTGRKYDVSFIAKMKQSAKLTPRVIYFLCQVISGFIAASSDIAADFFNKIVHCLSNAWSFWETRTSVIKICFSHSLTLHLVCFRRSIAFLNASVLPYSKDTLYKNKSKIFFINICRYQIKKRNSTKENDDFLSILSVISRSGR